MKCERREEGAEVQRMTAFLPFLERLAIFGTQCHAVQTPPLYMIGSEEGSYLRLIDLCITQL